MRPSPSAAEEEAPIRHAEFYFTDEMTVFQVCGPPPTIHTRQIVTVRLLFVVCVGREPSFPCSPEILDQELSYLQCYVLASARSQRRLHG
jgi:hypothetical protein